MNSRLRRARRIGPAYEEFYAADLRRGDMIFEIIEVVEGAVPDHIPVVKHGDRRARCGRSGIGQSNGDETQDCKACDSTSREPIRAP